MKLLGFGLAWAGYTLLWWGWSSLQGPGIGIMDLVIPGRVPKHVSEAASAPGNSGISSGNLQPATPQQLGGPLGAGLFLPKSTLGGQQ